jgi:hypothetical protein
MVPASAGDPARALRERIPMPDHARVTVAAEHVPAVLDALVNVYGARADVLAEAAGRPDSARLQDARAALLDADGALDALGWEPGPRLGAAELSGSPRLVADVLTAAVTEGAARFDGAIGAYGRGAAGLDELGAAHAQLGALLALFTEHEGEQAV